MAWVSSSRTHEQTGPAHRLTIARSAPSAASALGSITTAPCRTTSCDQPADTVGLGVPVAKLRHCSGNTMVWLGHGPYPAHLPSCFTVTTDVDVWNRAVAHWTQTYGG